MIRYIPHNELDRAKWDACIDRSGNGVIYAYSAYLDRMATSWDALVMDEYDAVMPLPFRRKFGIDYLYQPAFVAAGGVFGQHLAASTIVEFMQSIPSRFRLIEISLNHGNRVEPPLRGQILRMNYVLLLNSGYHQLASGYRESLHRNIKRALQSGCRYQQDISIDDIISLNKTYAGGNDRVIDTAYTDFRNLYETLAPRNMALTRGIVNAKNELMASAVFFFSHGRAYYILPGNHPNGRTLGASHLLIDQFIREYAGQSLTLDFEGSDVQSLAFFYSSFGATQEPYPALRINRLPFLFRWLKK